MSGLIIGAERHKLFYNTEVGVYGDFWGVVCRESSCHLSFHSFGPFFFLVLFCDVEKNAGHLVLWFEYNNKMNLFETLDTYQTNPEDEIQKISEVLKRKVFVDFTSRTLKYVFEKEFKNSAFASYEPTMDFFLRKHIIAGCLSNDSHDVIISYRYYCEFLLAMIDDNIKKLDIGLFEDDLKQLERLILNGLARCGYELVRYKNHRVTKKKDAQAEAIAATSKEHNKNILDYLLSKTVTDKEKVLTALAIQLEAIPQKENYLKQTREYVQLLRHKAEKAKEPKYAWFFEKESYEENLDKLFRVFLSIIAYDNCSSYLKEFETKKNETPSIG